MGRGDRPRTGALYGRTWVRGLDAGPLGSGWEPPPVIKLAPVRPGEQGLRAGNYRGPPRERKLCN
jgi:hypothetical protein